MTPLNTITNKLDDYLNIPDFQDYSQNGLQISGKNNVRRIAGLVDASLEGFAAAADANADMIIVHHGLLWGKPVSITGTLYERVKILIENNISLYAAHLPLDAHIELGNNAQLANILNSEIIGRFAEFGGQQIGCITKLPKTRMLTDVIQDIDSMLNTQTRVLDFGNEEINTMAIVSGAACEALPDAAEHQVDLFITGEPRLSAYHEARELEINVAFAGHYATECVGIQALIEQLPQWFDVDSLFIDIPCEL
ncbi:MAG: Nif3-like dinuclear metal center hexameric protein [Victivallaceae bacterium]|nr:Nif3-like dinuclear metal center hexameric protein [Victivallaceae bacterium]